MAEAPISSGGFKISEGPITSSRPSRQRAEAELSELPRHQGKPLLVAIPKNATTLFVCWSVDWTATFADETPSDRTVHLQLKSREASKTIAVEPMRATYSVEDLIPGEVYHVELGYHAPTGSWQRVASASEVMMPLLSETAEEEFEVASMPFHLSFQRLLEVFGTSRDEDLAEKLARLQHRAGVAGDITAAEREILLALRLGEEDLSKTRERKEKLTRVGPVRQRLQDFAGSLEATSPGGSSWP